MNTITKLLPGLLVMNLLLAAALAISQVPWFSHLGMSMLTLSILIGAIVGNIFPKILRHGTAPGIQLAQQNMLRWGVALYGFNLSLHEILQVGPAAILIDIIMVTGTLVLGWFIGVRYFKMDPQTVILTSAGSAICGAAAVVATEPVLNAPAHKTAAAVGTVVLFGTLAMVVYPVVEHILGIDHSLFGVYAGSTVHEVAQVVAIGKTIGEHTADTAVIVKMIRVMFLAPFLLIVGRLFPQQGHGGETVKAKAPTFAIAFIVIALVHPYLHLPEALVQIIRQLDIYLLAMAMGALGVHTTIEKLKKAGKDAITLASILFLWLMIGGGFVNAIVQHLVHHASIS